MRAVDVIRKKRDGEALSRDEIQFFVNRTTTGEIPPYQASAFLMAVVWRGMSAAETEWLAGAMAGSGARIDLNGVAGPKVDKHSTGGVGDKTSPILASLAAACGVIVPMISGRALGHTGGTLDKLESIPGFRTSLTSDQMRSVLGRIGCCLVGQTDEIAPADRMLYALRDATATVESIPLIAASIMSKKLAVELDGLVLDVTMGRGAFMKTRAAARQLAEQLVSIGAGAGLPTRALITAMDAPRGCAVGNALEIIECVETLKGRGPTDLEALSVQLAAEMVHMADVEPSEAEATRRVRAALESGAGLEKFSEIIEAQGGDARVLDDYRRLPTARLRRVIGAPRDGYLTALDAGLVGRSTVALGAGRDRVDQAIDHAVGAVVHARPGDALRRGDPIIELHYQRPEDAAQATRLVEQAVVIDATPPPPEPVLIDRVA